MHDIKVDVDGCSLFVVVQHGSLMYCIAFITHPRLIFVYTKLRCNCRLISLNCGTREINEMKLELRKPKQVLMQRPLLHPDGLRFFESAITQMSVSISFDGQLPDNSYL